MKKSFKILSLMIILCVINFSNAQGQVTTSGIKGNVVDEQKKPLMGANILITHVQTNSVHGTTTNLDGDFNLQGLKPGEYNLSASYIGFKKIHKNGIMLHLGVSNNFTIEMIPDEGILDEIVVLGSSSKFSNEKNGVYVNISSSQIENLPAINRNITDITRISGYSNGMGFGGSDGRSTNFTIDGANFNNNFGLSSTLPGGGMPISIESLDEIQIVVSPFDVKQTNFIGGGINAITKSGGNLFKGTAYAYFQNQEMRGNVIDGKDLGVRPVENKKTYGITLGGPIIENKLFFFVNYEQDMIPREVIKYRAAQDGEIPSGMISRTLASDMEKVSNHLQSKYGYNPGSYNNFPAEETNRKILARIDWNINNSHRLAIRYNNTSNVAWNEPNGTSMDGGTRATDGRVSTKGFSYANSMYSTQNDVWSLSVDLNSRFKSNISNQLLFTYTNIEDMRGTNSSIFPFIDILYGDAYNQSPKVYEPYISAGYELFTYNNGVKNYISNITDNFTYYLGKHKLTAGISAEHQIANNAYMRNGTGYYRYASLEDFLNGNTPINFALTYGWNGNKSPNAQITFNQFGIYLQEEWEVNNKLKLNGGIRFDEIMYDNGNMVRNNAIYALNFNGRHIDTGHWPASNLQISPRLSFIYDILENKKLTLRGGTGVFTGRLPLVFLTNMPTNSNMVQNSYSTSDPQQLSKLNGGIIKDVNDMINILGLPTNIDDSYHVAGTTISGVADNFKMPQIWKSNISLDYQLPFDFPITLTGELTFNKNINAVTMTNINIKDNKKWEHFNGADNRQIYPAKKAEWQYIPGTNAVILENTNKGYGYIAHVAMQAKPINNLNLLASYTFTESKEITGMPGNAPVSVWQNLVTVDGPNFSELSRSQYVIPHRVIANVDWYIPFTKKGVVRGTHLNLFYQGYSPYGNSFIYTNDINGDGSAQDLIYIPKNNSEINFISSDDSDAFWKFVEQDSYLNSHKGQYAEAYAARSPWVNKFDLKIIEDFTFKTGKKEQKIEASVTILNISNMLNSKWGVTKTNACSNYNKILKYEGTNENNEPVFSMYKINGKYISNSYESSKDYNECWKIQLGLKYTF